MNEPTDRTGRQTTEMMGRLAAPALIPTTQMRTLLVARADDESLLDVGYTVVDSPLGRLLIAATRDGVVRIAFAREGHDDVLATLADAISPRILRAPGRTDDASSANSTSTSPARAGASTSRSISGWSSGFRRTV